MIAPSSSILHHPADNLVVDTREVIKPLLDIFQKYDMDEDVLLQAILQSLTHERSARDELSFLCTTPVGQWVHDPDGYLLGECILYTNEAARLANAMYKLGEHLVRCFQQYRMYQRGYLPYQFQQRYGRDLILTRLSVPQLNVPKYKTPDRFDLDSFFERFEVR